MEECVFCGLKTSFIYKGDGEYNEKAVCPKCQSERFNTNFNTGCSKEEDCSIKINRK